MLPRRWLAAVLFLAGLFFVTNRAALAQSSTPTPNPGSSVNPFPHPPHPGGIPMKPPPPGTYWGPVNANPFAHPAPIPSPWANGVPPHYKPVPNRVFPIAPQPSASPSSEPTSLLFAPPGQSLLNSVERFANWLYSPDAAYACEGTIGSPYYVGWDCDTPVQLATQFEGGGPGASVSGGFWVPPDTDGAVGSNDVVTFINGAFYVWDRSGNPIEEMSASSFWCPNVTTPYGCDPIDPRIVHDVNYGDSRWVVSSLAGEGNTDQYTLLAVSDSEDPTGGWHFYVFDSCEGNFGDQPKLGVNSQWVSVLDICGGATTLTVFDKANLYAGGIINNKFFQSISFSNISQPAIQAPATSTDEFLVGISDPLLPCTGGGCFTSAKFNSLSVGLVAGTVDSPTFYPNYYTVKLPNSGYIDAPAGGQLGTTVLVGNEQAEISSAVVQLLPPYNFEYLYAAFPLGLPASSPSRSGVEWVQIDDQGHMVQSGIVQDTTNVASYHAPSIAVSPYGYGLLGYSDFSKNYYPRGDYKVLDLNLPASGGTQSYTPDEDLNFAGGTFVTSQTYWTGDPCPCNKLICTASGAQTCARWGDYSSTVVDPYNPTNLWTIQEYLNLSPIPPPTLSSSGASPSPQAMPTPTGSTVQDTKWLEVYTGQ